MQCDKPAHMPTDEPGIEFAPGIFADHVLKQQGWSWLEDFLALPLPTIIKDWEEKFTYNDAVPVFAALLLQRNSRMIEREAVRLVCNLDAASFHRQLRSLGSIGVDAGIYKSPRGRPIG